MPKGGVDRRNLRLLMICAFRYSLGRSSHIPSTIVNLIIDNYELFNDKDWSRFIEEIEAEDNLGDGCDIRTWNKLIEFSEKQLKKDI